MAPVIVSLASAVCGVSILAAIVAVGYIYNDINTFFDDTIKDMEEFKVIANDAWSKMVTTNHQLGRSRREAYKERKSVVTKRNVVALEPDICESCGILPNTCPPGPPGPPGTAGEVGYDGEDGEVGISVVATTIAEVAYYPECISCPAGMPGPRGVDGHEGVGGFDGKDGAPGEAGQDGTVGEPGPEGDAGQSGEAGADGRPGAPGGNSTAGTAKPGPPGKVGVEGPAGNPGTDGESGDSGADGDVGPRGAHGNPGDDGVDGDDGATGVLQVPGHDAEYCPCPLRTTVYPTWDNAGDAVVRRKKSGHRKRRWPIVRHV